MSPPRMNVLAHTLLDAGRSLDPTPVMHARLDAEYRRLGDFIESDSRTRFSASAEVYPQGSKALGTVVRPIRDGEQYDLDAVYRRDILVTSTTREALLETTGAQLTDFVAEVRRSEGDGFVSLHPRRRCWTLVYADFHIDVLPAVPADEQRPPADPILITDRGMHRWQPSNPLGLIRWFRRRMREPLALRHDEMAKAAGVKVHEVEDDAFKTPLQVAVQVLKRHRDLHFAETVAQRPVSIVLTTLATQAYGGELDYHEAIRTIARDADAHVARVEGRWSIPNPVHPAENFADRWNESPELPDAFFAWLRKLRADLDDLESRLGRGRHELHESLRRSLGGDVADGVTKRADARMKGLREEGQLRVSGAGRLGTEGAVRVKEHTFYGEDPET